MLTDINLSLIMIAAFVASASPGPATLSIAGTSMAHGRGSGLLVASGITTGSLVWSVSAALGLGALMLAHVWVFELIRYLGAGYLLFLAYKSARSALSARALKVNAVSGGNGAVFSKGFALHITNPKAIMFFGSLYSIGIPPDATWGDLSIVILAIWIQSIIVFHSYALLFSSKSMTQIYMRMRRWFEAAFAIGFGLASFKILTARLQ